MKWSFGIITSGENWHRVAKVCNSIRLQNDEDQIVVVGASNMPKTFYDRYNVNYIPFNESIKRGWITRKKNLVAEVALNDNLCIMHDYVQLDNGWRAGFEEFGDDWLTCTNKIFNMNGERFRDWAVIGNDAWHDFNDGRKPPFREPGRLLSYNTKLTDELARWFYYSGAFYCIKKKVALEVPLDENRAWGDGEDVFFSRQLYFKYGHDVFSLNTYSSVTFLKNKNQASWEHVYPLSHEDL